jgi:hypothetical protein
MPLIIVIYYYDKIKEDSGNVLEDGKESMKAPFKFPSQYVDQRTLKEFFARYV